MQSNGVKSQVNPQSKQRNKGGRPLSVFPKHLAILMEDKDLTPGWIEFGKLFGINGQSSYKMLFERNFYSVEQFIVAAERLGVTPRRLLDIFLKEQLEFHERLEKRREEQRELRRWASRRTALVQARALRGLRRS